MILFNERPTFEEAWAATTFRVLMAGLGNDTITLIAEAYERGYEFDEIIFCDTDSEFYHTYQVFNFLQSWCAERGWSKITRLKKFDGNGRPLSVIGIAEVNRTLPPAAFGTKTCSYRFKTETADVYLNNHPGAWEAWGVKRKGTRLASHKGVILRAIGVNADEPERADDWAPQHKWVQVYPLLDWGIGDEGSGAVERVGLYLPGKSSCICCPHLTGRELAMLRDDYPADFARVQALEKAYQDSKPNPDIGPKGLCRKDTIATKLAAYEKNPKYRTALEEQRCKECGH